MTSLASHRYDEIPAVGGSRIFHQVADEFRADMPCGFKTEGGHAAGQGQVIVNGLGNMGNPNCATRCLDNLARRKCRVVTADSDEVADA